MAIVAVSLRPVCSSFACPGDQLVHASAGQLERRGVPNSTGRRSAPHPGHSAHASQADMCVWSGVDVFCVCASVCGAGHAHSPEGMEQTHIYPRMRSPGAFCAA
eukprot:4774295-Prymnesium_polylepis.1